MRHVFVGALAGLLLTACTSTGSDTEQMTVVNGGLSEEEEELVCRNRRLTGSHFRRRVCLRQYDWDRMEQDAERSLQDTLRGDPYEGGQRTSPE